MQGKLPIVAGAALVVIAFIIFLLTRGGGDEAPAATTNNPGGSRSTIATIPPGGQGTTPAGGGAATATRPAGAVATAPAASGSTPPTSGGGAANLAAVGQAFAQAGDYTLTTVIRITGPVVQEIRSTVEVKPSANAYRATVSGIAGVPPQRIIGIGNMTYIDSGSGTYLLVPGNSLPNNPNSFLQTINGFWNSNANRTGTKTVGGVTCDNYEITLPTRQKGTVCVSQNRPLEVTFNDATTTTTATFVYGNVPAITAPR